MNPLAILFDVAQVTRDPARLEETIDAVLQILNKTLGDDVGLAFYKWNPYEEEFVVLSLLGSADKEFDLTVAPGLLEKKERGGLHFFVSGSNQGKEGLFSLLVPSTKPLDNDQKKLVKTIAIMMGPALLTIRQREEEAARLRLEKKRGTPLKGRL